MRGLPSFLSLFPNKFNKFNNKRAQMLRFFLSYDMKISLKFQFWFKKSYNFVNMYAKLLWTS